MEDITKWKTQSKEFCCFTTQTQHSCYRRKTSLPSLPFYHTPDQPGKVRNKKTSQLFNSAVIWQACIINASCFSLSLWGISWSILFLVITRFVFSVSHRVNIQIAASSKYHGGVTVHTNAWTNACLLALNTNIIPLYHQLKSSVKRACYKEQQIRATVSSLSS